MNSNIYITGMSGFIGFHLQNELKKSFSVSGIDALNVNSVASNQRKGGIDNLTQASIHASFLDVLPTKPTVLVHLAAETGIAGSLTNPALYFHQNLEGTFNVLEQCRKNGVKYLIYASSSSVYEPNHSVMTETSPHDKQLSFYGTSKRMTEIMVENYCKQFGITAIGLRFFTVYGSWTRPDMAAYKFMNAIDKSESINLYNDGNVYRDFTHVSDIVESIKRLITIIQEEKSGFHEVFNIGFGAPVSVKKYAEIIAQHLEKELFFQSKSLPENELNSTHSDSQKLEKYIGFKPKSAIEDGIKEMTTWFKSNRYE